MDKKVKRLEASMHRQEVKLQQTRTKLMLAYIEGLHEITRKHTIEEVGLTPEEKTEFRKITVDMGQWLETLTTVDRPEKPR